MHKVTDLAIGEGPRDDEVLLCRERVVQLVPDEVVGHFKRMRLRCSGRGAAVRRRCRQGARFPRHQLLLLWAQAYAGLDFLTNIWVYTGLFNREKRGGVG